GGRRTQLDAHRFPGRTLGFVQADVNAKGVRCTVGRADYILIDARLLRTGNLPMMVAKDAPSRTHGRPRIFAVEPVTPPAPTRSTIGSITRLLEGRIHEVGRRWHCGN